MKYFFSVKTLFIVAVKKWEMTWVIRGQSR